MVAIMLQGEPPASLRPPAKLAIRLPIRYAAYWIFEPGGEAGRPYSCVFCFWAIWSADRGEAP